MKAMKKVIAITLIALLALSLFACAKTETPAKPDEKPADSGDAQSTADGDAAVKTVTEGKLVMATNAAFPPYEYIDGDKIVGIDAEVAGLIAEKLGLELEIADIEFDSIVPGVQSGKYDMGMAGMTVNEERKQKVNFTDTYAKGIQSVIVKADGAIKSLDDLEGKMIGAQQGTTGAIYASDDYGADHVTTYANGNLAVEALKTGKVDCVIIDNEPAKAFVAANADAGLTILDTAYADENYAICIAKDNTALLEKVNEALNALIADGSVQKIVDKYIPAEAEETK